MYIDSVTALDFTKIFSQYLDVYANGFGNSAVYIYLFIYLFIFIYIYYNHLIPKKYLRWYTEMQNSHPHTYKHLHTHIH